MFDKVQKRVIEASRAYPYRSAQNERIHLVHFALPGFTASNERRFVLNFGRMKSKIVFLLGTCFLWALQFTTSAEALFNITSNVLRTGQPFNLTLSDACNINYTVNFGDSSPVKNLGVQQKIISHAYSKSGSYQIEVRSNGPPSGVSLCSKDTKSVVVRDPIQNLTTSLNSSICRTGDHVGISVQVIPVQNNVTVYWRMNKTDNWTMAPIECATPGKKDVYFMAENDVSVLTSECFELLTVLDFNFTFKPQVGVPNWTIEITRSSLTGISDESNFTFLWDFSDGDVINCPNQTVKKYFSSSNPDPGYAVTLAVYNQAGHSARLQRYIKIYDPVQPPIHVSYPKITQDINTPLEFAVAPHVGHDVLYIWNFGNNFTQNSTSRNITYSYTSIGEYCVILMAQNQFSHAVLSFKISVAEAVEGFGFVKNITSVETGSPTNIGIEISNGSKVNVSVSFGDGSKPVWIVNIDNIMDIFVISVWHNYTKSGPYNVTITAQNLVNTVTASKIAKVQDSVTDLTVEKNFQTECLEVNGTLSICLTANGSDPKYYYDFGDGTNLTSTMSVANHSYSTHDDYILNVTVFNDVSSISNITNITVCKPVIPIASLAVSTSPTNITDLVQFNMTLAEGSDFECFFDFGDGAVKFFPRECYNLTYFADGVNTDKTSFLNLAFEVSHNYSEVGEFRVFVNCSNRLSTANFSLFAIVQKPIEDLDFPKISPKILGKKFPVSWTMTNGTNVTFILQIQGTPVNYSSLKTDTGDSPEVSVSSNGVFLVTLQATNLVSEANRSIILIIQEDVKNVVVNTSTTTSDFGANICGFGDDKNIFPCEYPVNFTATPDKGYNLTFWWRFGDGKEQNTSESSITHQFPDEEKDYWTNVTVFNLVSSVTKMYRVKTERSVMNLAITDNSPVKVNLTTSFQLSFSKYGTRTCITMDMGDKPPVLFLFGGRHCITSYENYYEYVHSNESTLSIAHRYIYKTVDDFLVKVNAKNTVSNQSLVFKSVTSRLNCHYPNASILDVSVNASTAKIVKRSETVLIKTLNQVDCEASKTTAFLWDVYKISKNPVIYQPQEESSVQYMKNKDQSYLNLPATSLNFGFYKLHFTISMKDVIGISGSAVGFIHVVATKGSLQAAIEGGPRRRVKFGNDAISLDAKPSVDLDYADINEASPEYHWLCRNSSEPPFNTSGNILDIPIVLGPIQNCSIVNASENLGGCFGTGRGRLNLTGPLVKIDSKCGMAENATYVITLVLFTHNPFFTKRAVVNQRLELVKGDPPQVNVTCKPSCPSKVNIDQKLQLRGSCVKCFGRLTFEWALYRHNSFNIVDVTDTTKMKKVPDLKQISTTPIDSIDLAVKENKLARDTRYTAVFKAIRQSGQYGIYFHTFVTNSPPENGTCYVTPKEGSAMNTSFSIACSDWADPDPPLTYEFAYTNSYQPSVLYVSHVSNASSIFLPMGHEANNFKLPLRLRIIDYLGAATTVHFNIKVTLPPVDKKSLSDIISDEDGLLKEAMKTGNLQKVVETVGAVCSILNFMSRDDERNGQNATETVTVSKDAREKFRKEIIDNLAEFKVSNVNQIKLVGSALGVATQQPNEVDTQAGEKALSTITTMASVLDSPSIEKAGFEGIQDGVAAVISVIGNLAVSSSLLAKVDANNTNENITGYTSNSTDGGTVSSKERARNRTLKCFEARDTIAKIVLRYLISGDIAVEVNTPFLNMTLKKRLLEKLGDSEVSNGKTKFRVPSLNDMGISIDPNGTNIYSSVDVVMSSSPENTLTWSNSSQEVKTYLVGLTLRDEYGKPLNTSNFTSDVHIHIPRKTSQLPKQEEFYVIPLGNNQFIQYHTVKVRSANYSVHIQVIPQNNSKEMSVLFRYNERPAPDKFDYNWTIPNFSNCSFRNVSRNVSSSLNSTGGASANSTARSNAAETGYQVEIDVVRDCVIDPYTVSISNSLVTKAGTYYLGVYYKTPDREPDVEPATANPTGGAERKRRGLPLACSGHGRMKRSCVIIPPPPPKPTTPSKGRTKASNVDFQGNTFNPNETERYVLRVFSSNCLFWDEQKENWINKGCKVGEETKPELIHCKCNHLTSFASDFLVAPNPIDFDKVFSADIGKNLVVLLVVCLIFGLYILLAVIARRFDKKDLEKTGATAVSNRGEASFSYLISVRTGVRQNAGTTSSVFIVLSGDEWESPPMPLVDYYRKVFQRGQENNFVVTLPRSLGNINHIRIWHDNFGNNASWYLSRVSVDDLRTEERWYFICERWLAVEEDDGRVDRILPVASDKELTHFQHLFVNKTVRELGDGHLWFSVVTRPANSPFSRVQRVSCCLSLLCLTMVTNAMFYKIGRSAGSPMMIRIGTYEFDLKGLIIGVQASLIVFPVNLALVQIFRSVRPKRSKQDPDLESTEGSEGRKNEGFSDISRCTSRESLPPALREACSLEKDENKDGSKKYGKPKRKKNGIPYGFVYVAWVLCFLSSVTSAAFTVFYSLAWGPEIANKWLLAFVTSFFQSILVIQPFKVVIVALLFAIFIRKPMDSDDDVSVKKELKDSRDGKETGDDIVHDYDENDDEKQYGPPDDEFLKVAREQRLKEVQMSQIIKEVSAYLLFVVLLLLVAYGNRDPYAYLLKKNLHDIFVDVDETGVDLADADDLDLFFHWSRETLVPNLYPSLLYNNKSDKYTGFIDDRNNYLVGISRFRQARVKKDTCKVVEDFKPYFNDCLAEYSLLNEDKVDYDVGWAYLNKTHATNARRRRSVEEQFAFRHKDKKETLAKFGDSSRVRLRRAIEPIYTSTSGRQQRKRKRPGNTAKTYYVLDSAVLPDGSIISCPTRWVYHDTLKLRGYPFWGHMNLYSGGGYPADLGYDYSTALTVIADLHSHNWVDSQTRAVFIEFTVYNANTNLFGIAFMFIEFLPTGGAFPQVQFVVSRLYSYVGPYSKFILACQIFLVLFMFYFMYREGKTMYKQRKAYFRGFFNWMEVVLIVCEFAMGILYLTRWLQVEKNFLKLRHNPKDFVSFQYAGAADESLSLIMGLLVFLVTLRFLKLLKFNKRMSLLGSTIADFAKPLGSFFFTFMLVFLAFAFLSFLVFSSDNEKFKNFVTTFETQTSIILGDFDYKDIERTNRVLGPFYFFTFMYFCVFYLLNMFVAIINDSFADVKTSNDKKMNEYEMVEFILSRFKESLGLQNRIGTARKSPGFPTSPPFCPSDYKFRDDEGSLGRVSPLMEVDDRVLASTRILRTLASMNKNVDQLTMQLERCSKNEEEADKLLLNMLNTMKESDALRPHISKSKRLSISSSYLATEDV